MRGGERTRGDVVLGALGPVELAALLGGADAQEQRPERRGEHQRRHGDEDGRERAGQRQDAASRGLGSGAGAHVA